MAAPDKTGNRLLEPPYMGLTENQSDFTKFLLELWNRSGGFNAKTTDLAGLEASVKELNTLVKINTGELVQTQLNSKANISSLGTMAEQNSSNVAITGGSIQETTISRSPITINAGNTSIQIQLGGTLNRTIQDAGNVGAPETTLLSYTMPANVLNLPGGYISIMAYGIIAANSNNKQIKLKFGASTVIDTGSVAANSGSWQINAVISYKSSIIQSISSSILSDNSLILNKTNFLESSEDSSASIVIECTGQGTSDDDIVQKGLLTQYLL